MNKFKLLELSAMVFLVVVSGGCSKKQPEQPEQPEKTEKTSRTGISMTKEQFERLDRLENELDQELKEEFSKEAIARKSMEFVNRILDSEDTMQRIGNLRVALKLKPDDNLEEFFKIVPEHTVEQIAALVKTQAEEAVRKENNLLKDEDIPRVVRERLPLLPDRTKIEFKTLQGRHVSGMIVQRNKAIVKIGSQLVNREDIPSAVRAQIWPEENEERIQQMIRDEQSKNRFYYKKNLALKISQLMPKALLAGGYVPNVFKEGASLKNDNVSMWVTRQQWLSSVKARVSSEREAYKKDFWKRKGFAGEPIDGERQ